MNKKPKRNLLEQFVALVIERKIREAELSDGSKTSHGSEKHIKELEHRISDLESWKNRQKKGSEKRANYARLINNLKSELRSAKRNVK